MFQIYLDIGVNNVMVNIKLCASAAGKVLSRDDLRHVAKSFLNSKEDLDLYTKLKSWELWLIKAGPCRGARGVVHLWLSQKPV